MGGSAFYNLYNQFTMSLKMVKKLLITIKYLYESMVKMISFLKFL